MMRISISRMGRGTVMMACTRRRMAFWLNPTKPNDDREELLAQIFYFAMALPVTM
jgi:hypothetical protein